LTTYLGRRNDAVWQDQTGRRRPKARQVAKAIGKRQPAEMKLAELKLRLLEISDLAAAGALLGWDQST